MQIPEELKRGATVLSDLTHQEAFDLVDPIRRADVILVIEDDVGSVIKGSDLLAEIQAEKLSRGVVLMAFHADNNSQVNSLFSLLERLAVTEPAEDHIAGLAFADMITQQSGRAN